MRIVLALALLCMASPALAGGTAVPEPSTLALFGLGVLGVVVGRYGAKRRRPD